MKNIVENQDIKTDKTEMEGLRNQLAAVVAENAALKSAVDLIASAYTEGEPAGFEIDRARHIETPDTDAAVREIEARGVEKLAEHWRKAAKLANDDGEFRAAHRLAFDAVRAEGFAEELREGK